MSDSANEVAVMLGGREETLRPTLRAAREVNNRLGGFVEAFRRLTNFDLEAYSIIVAAGLNKKPSEVEEAVYKAGVAMLTEPLAKFVTLLANGGREPKNNSSEEAPAGEG